MKYMNVHGSGEIKDHLHNGEKRRGCGCGHDHEEHACGHQHCGHGHEHGGEAEERRPLIIRLIVSAVLTACALLLPLGKTAAAVLMALAYLIAGYDVLLRSLSNIRSAHFFDENLLMSVASLGAMLLGEMPEGVAVMVLYQVGEMLQDLAVDHSRRSISELMDVRPDEARIETEEGLREVRAQEVPAGSVIVIRPGEKVPLDGTVLSGSTVLDTSALTGESMPRQAAQGDTVLAGAVNLSGLIRVRTTKDYSNTTAAQILELVEEAESRKASSERFMTRFAAVYTPAVVGLAVLTAVLPPLMGLGTFAQWIRRALNFLVISCPCALVISVPLTFYCGIGGASRRGILMKGAIHLENLAKASVAVFDKTGTLTGGVFTVTDVRPERCTPQALLELAAKAESGSNHPIAEALRRAVDVKNEDIPADLTVQDLPGSGLVARFGSNTVAVGNEKLMHSQNIAFTEEKNRGTVVYVAQNNVYLGVIIVEDVVKPASREAIAELRKLGIQKAVMLTGDHEETAQRVAREVNADEVLSRQLPDGKVRAVQKLHEGLRGGSTLLFVGDGINDAPVLAQADVGFAMGALGSDAAIEAADVVLMDDDPLKVPLAVRIARRTMRICRENILFSLAVKLLVLVLSAIGAAGMWMAVFADVGVCLIAVANALRSAGRLQKREKAAA